MHWKAKKNKDEKATAKERIDKLFELASTSQSRELRNRYVNLARRIAMRLKVRIKPEYKRRYCSHCHNYFKPGINLRVRNANGHTVYYCMECKKYTRYLHKSKKRIVNSS